MKPSICVWLSLAFVGLFVTQARADVTLVSKPITGVVIDASTGRPIADAVVTAKWIGGFSTVAHGGTRCAKGMATTTDASGHFSFSEWTMTHPNLDNLLVEVGAYRPGWADIDRGTAGAHPTKFLGFIPAGRIEIPPSDLRVKMQPFTGTPQERRAYLLGFMLSTACDDGDVAKMGPLYRAIRDEAAAMPPEVRDFRSMPGRLTLMEVIDQGYLRRTR